MEFPNASAPTLSLNKNVLNTEVQKEFQGRKQGVHWGAQRALTQCEDAMRNLESKHYPVDKGSPGSRGNQPHVLGQRGGTQHRDAQSQGLTPGEPETQQRSRPFSQTPTKPSEGFKQSNGPMGVIRLVFSWLHCRAAGASVGKQVGNQCTGTSKTGAVKRQKEMEGVNAGVFQSRGLPQGCKKHFTLNFFNS